MVVLLGGLFFTSVKFAIQHNKYVYADIAILLGREQGYHSSINAQVTEPDTVSRLVHIAADKSSYKQNELTRKYTHPHTYYF